MARWHSANVLQRAGDTRRLWNFTYRGDNTPQLAREETRLPNEPLPPRLVSKDWQTLYQPRLNIAWLPADKVFIRVVQLPPADTIEETRSMVELQLEKLSPLPVAQIVWTFELLPKTLPDTQTVIVVVAARHLVEEFLGKLEGDGYTADRLEVPFIDQLLATKVVSDGVWIYPGSDADENTCLITWWSNGSLQNITLLHLPGLDERGAFVREQIAQIAWAGELEGWIANDPRRFLVANEETAAVWRPLLETPDQPVEVVPPVPDTERAALTAKRVAQADGVATLVPPEYTARYRQQFIDRIWMRTLGAVLVLYLVGVVAYLGWLQVLKFQVQKIERQAQELQGSYTNALKLKAQVQVMEDQLNLQFAALECYRAVASSLPEGITVDSMTFQRGRSFLIYGSGDVSPQVVDEFNDLMRKYTAADGQPLFKDVKVANKRLKPGTQTLTWDFACELRRPESE